MARIISYYLIMPLEDGNETEKGVVHVQTKLLLVILITLRTSQREVFEIILKLFNLYEFTVVQL